MALSFRFIASLLENLNPLELFLDGLNGKLVPLLNIILWEDVWIFKRDIFDSEEVLADALQVEGICCWAWGIYVLDLLRELFELSD